MPVWLFISFQVLINSYLSAALYVYTYRKTGAIKSPEATSQFTPQKENQKIIKIGKKNFNQTALILHRIPAHNITIP